MRTSFLRYTYIVFCIETGLSVITVLRITTFHMTNGLDTMSMPEQWRENYLYKGSTKFAICITRVNNMSTKM